MFLTEGRCSAISNETRTKSAECVDEKSRCLTKSWVWGRIHKQPCREGGKTGSLLGAGSIRIPRFKKGHTQKIQIQWKSKIRVSKNTKSYQTRKSKMTKNMNYRKIQEGKMKETLLKTKGTDLEARDGKNK